MTLGGNGANGHGARLKVLVVGVGGQGVLTAARMVGEAAFSAGIPVVIGQLHGMSQRGGSVRSTVLIGPGDGSFIGPGEAHLVIALEPLEALRALGEMSRHTNVVVNTAPIAAPNLAHDGLEYPGLPRILSALRAAAGVVLAVDGEAIVRTVGVARALNFAMLGAAAGLGVLPFGDENLLSAISRRSSAGALAANRLAFSLGREAVKA